MRVVSVNVGPPREIVYHGELVLTGIFKSPVEGRVAMRTLNFDGDRQADLRVHGGPEKAVYVYPLEHYDFWRALLETDKLPPGSFGENLTVEGITEDAIHIGDRLRVGTAEVVVTQPRVPCFKLAAKFERPQIVREFLASGRSGFYLAVAAEGEAGAGDAIVLLSRDPESVSVADLNHLFRARPSDPSVAHDLELMRRAVRVKALAASWREILVERLETVAQV